MNVLKSLFVALALSLMAVPATQAQTTMKDAIFSAVEKRIIRDYYGVKADAQPSDNTAPEWAVKNGDDDEDEQEDEARDDQDEQKKDKGKKGKGSGKANGKGKGKFNVMPPGLAKRHSLPPGLARQLKEKGRLPPGLAKLDLPTDLASQLPVRPADPDVTVVEGDVVLTDKATGIILDVIKGVVVNGTKNTPNADGTLAPPASQDQAAEENLLDAVLKGIFGSGN